MEETPVTAATGALGPVIAKLAALLGSEYKLRCRTRRDVSFIRSKLKPIHSILWNIWEREELDEASKELKMEALDLADELDDAISDFILSLERSRNNKRLVQTKIKESPFQDFKKRASDVSGRCCLKWEKKEKPAVSASGELATDDSRPGKPRAYPFVRKDVSELVGMLEPRDELIQHLVGKDETTPSDDELKVAFIYGTAGMGKTTLANLVYEAIGDKFYSRAFVSVTPGGNMREVLASILQQVAPNSRVPLAGTEASTEEHLIDIILNFLKDRRYLVIVDDIWNWREWGMIMKLLPENNLRSGIVGTTRMKDVVEKWRDDPDVLIHVMRPKWDDEEGWFYKVGSENIATRMADLVAEGFDYKHPIVHMCGGMPLAVCCMLSAVAQEREKVAQQGQVAKACDVQDEIEKHVMENGIQNTPGFAPLVESLQLCYDDLPHHMLKTCLLYCSIYPDGYNFQREDLVRRWIAEGLVYTKEEANGYFEELVNRGLIHSESEYEPLKMQPMLRNFLRWKSRQDNFITCSSEFTPSYNNTCRIRRLCIDNSPHRSSDSAEDPLSALDWNHIRSLIVYEGIERVPLEKLEGVRVLDLCSITGLQDHHLKDICGLVRVRHLLGLNGDGRNSEIPPEIVRLQCLETFEVSGDDFAPLAGFIGKLQQLKTLEVSGEVITELPREIGALQQLQTLRMRNTCIAELPREFWSLQQLKTLDMSCTRIMELPKEIGELHQLRTLDMSCTRIRELPKEIWELHQLRTLDMSNTEIRELPKEIGELHQLRTLDMSSTPIRVLPKEIVKLQHLEHLLMTGTQVAKIPREIGALKELKSLKLDNSITALPLEVCGALVELPECIHQALKKSDMLSDLDGEMLSFQKSRRFKGGGLVVGAKQMHIPSWIVREHFNYLAMLDIRICKLEERGLKILQDMPFLYELALRFEVVPREPVVISRGFATLRFLTVDSRVPRVTFQEGAMPRLFQLMFQFQFYSGPPNKGPVGVNYLRRLQRIEFQCNKDWYGGGESPCIRPTINVMRKEAQELPNLRAFEVCGQEEEIYWPPPSPPPPLEMGQQREMEEEEKRSCGVGEIEEDIQA